MLSLSPSQDVQTLPGVGRGRLGDRPVNNNRNGRTAPTQRTAVIEHFSNQWPLKALHSTASRSPIHALIHTLTAKSATQTASWSGAVRVRRLTQRHLDTLGAAGDQTINPPATSQPALPPEPHAGPNTRLLDRGMCCLVWAHTPTLAQGVHSLISTNQERV